VLCESVFVVLVVVLVLVLETPSFSQHFELPMDFIFANTHGFITVGPPNVTCSRTRTTTRTRTI
jgi:hypothetical protein